MNNPYSKWSNARLLDQTDVEVSEMNANKILISMTVDIGMLMAAVGAMQLACRHPRFVGPSRVIVERLINQLAHALKDYPAIVELIRRGGLKEHDVTDAEYQAFRLVRPSEREGEGDST